MSRLILNEGAAPAAPAAAKAAVYLTNDADPLLRMVDDAGRNVSLTEISNASVTSQAPAAAARTYITGSAIKIPANKLKVGTILRWTFSATKTAAGIAASTIDIAFGTLGTTGDTARVSFTKPAGTAAVDEARFQITAVVRSIGVAGVVVGNMEMTHNLAATGHAIIPCVIVTTVSAGFDTTTPTYVGVCITTGASDAITIQLVSAESVNL
jgi:hypothetical protein